MPRRTASSLVKIDLEGNIVWKPNTDYGINVSGYVIHGAIHMARADVACVLHTHTRAGMAVAAMQCGLLPLSQTAMRFVGHIGLHDYEGPAIDLGELTIAAGISMRPPGRENTLENDFASCTTAFSSSAESSPAKYGIALAGRPSRTVRRRFGRRRRLVLENAG